ncbi:hypothetical protein JN10_0847 [Altererythrobacter ishigakiensis]|uniref:Uncharacterized protein n=2 Tax=Altererythrobacter ishigakiensis TaxID=476157 RepID=A0A562UUB3_9SPHN|nr:hypothetical protein JN10_0847 [Altererythrobacter ishigakiensis]
MTGMVQLFRRGIIAAGITMSLVAVSPAASQSSEGEAQISQEEQVDNGLKNFGYIAGLSRGCVAEDQQMAFERDVMEMNAAITRLLGVDRAFLFSAAFGYGTSVAVEVENCAEILKQYESRSNKFRSAVEGS